jgi:multidrug resistance efflux pump
MTNVVRKAAGIDDGASTRAKIAQAEAKVAEQEAKVKVQESDLAKKTQERIIQRRGGGQRMLLSTERADSELGIQTTLGG